MTPFQTGWGEVDFTPEPGLSLFGQMHERRGDRVRDPLLASALAVGDGKSTVVLVSVDVCVLSTPFVRETQQQFEQQNGLPASSLLLHATHTHVSPATLSLLAAHADPEFVRHLQRAILQAASAAIAAMRPGDLFAGAGTLEQLGWNRRAMLADGSSVMYADAATPGFVGLEGPRDPALGVLFARDGSGALRGVVLNFSTHPNCLEGESFYSADLPGAVRQVLKSMFSADLVVVYLTGAAGNTAPSILDPAQTEQPWRGEEGVRRSGQYMAGEALKVIASEVTPMTEPVLRLETAALELPVRPWPEPTERCYPVPLLTDTWLAARSYYHGALDDWPRRLAEDNPVEVRVNALRIGDSAFCTNPAELFAEYGLQIRQHSPARVTFISELTDGYVGYVPTHLAFERGGYETWPAPSCQLSAGAGDAIVTATRELLQRAFKTA